MGGQPEALAKVMGFLTEAWDIAAGWLTSPAAWSQFALLAVAYLAARLLARRILPLAERLIGPKEGATGRIADLRRFLLRFLRWSCRFWPMA